MLYEWLDWLLQGNRADWALLIMGAIVWVALVR